MRLPGAVNMSNYTFEVADNTKVIVGCPKVNGSAPTAAAPCADDPRIVYRALDSTYYMTFGNDSGLDKTLSGQCLPLLCRVLTYGCHVPRTHMSLCDACVGMVDIQQVVWCAPHCTAQY